MLARPSHHAVVSVPGHCLSDTQDLVIAPGQVFVRDIRLPVLFTYTPHHEISRPGLSAISAIVSRFSQLVCNSPMLFACQPLLLPALSAKTLPLLEAVYEATSALPIESLLMMPANLAMNRELRLRLEDNSSPDNPFGREHSLV